MGSNSQTQSPIRFGVYEADLPGRTLRKSGVRIRLQEKPFRLLAMLLARPGEVVTREELQRNLWANEEYGEFDLGLNTAVKKLRQALDDSADSPRWIETIPKVGYRFLAPAEVGTERSATLVLQQEPESKRSSWLPAAVAGIFGVAIGATTVYLLQRGVGLEPRPPMEVAQLSFDSGLSFEPTLSGDGSLLAYSSTAAGGGDLDIWVKQVSGGNPIRLTSDPADDRQPNISRDGSRIVFRSDRAGGGIYAMPTLGGEPILVVQGDAGSNSPFHPRLSPDGEYVAYWAGNEFFNLSASQRKSFVVPVTGGPPRRLAENLDTAFFPIWSPDGESLLMLGALEGEFDWWLAPARGGPAQNTGAVDVLTRRLPSLPVAWDWQPGSNAVYFSAVSTGVFTFLSPRVFPRLSNLWRLPLSPKTGEVTGTLEQVTSGSGAQHTPAVAAGDRITYADTDINPNIWSAPLDEDRPALAGQFTRLIDDASWESRPSASRDGKQLAFRSDRGGGSDFWLKNLESGQVNQLSRDGRQKVFVFLSPDGSQAAYLDPSGATPSIFLARPGANEPRKLCQRCKVFGWFPDGKRLLAWWTDENRPYFGALDAEAARLEAFEGIDVLKGRSVTNQYGGANVGPSGRWIAATLASEASPRSLSIFSLEGLKLEPPVIEVSRLWGYEPHWHPSENGVFFMALQDGFNCLWAVDLDPRSKRPRGEAFAVQHFHDRQFPLTGSYWVSQDRVFVGIHETTGNIWLLEPSDRQQ